MGIHMLRSRSDRVSKHAARYLLLLALSVFARHCWGISANQFDDFNDGMVHGWSINNGLTPVFVAEHEGPLGENDHALLMSTTFIMHPRLLVLNVSQWTGNWTAANITQISLDVRNPNTFPLSMRLGIAGPGGVQAGGAGDTHVTGATTVPADNLWHSLTFDVLPANFTSISGENTAAALAAVSQFRVIHNPSTLFMGSFVEGSFYLDNIRAIAVPEPTMALIVLVISLLTSAGRYATG
jgi:hypothetical protein